MEIQHISHKHKLVFTSDDGGEGHGSVSCYGCRRPIVGGRYRCCTESCNFFLDKTCAELPGQILVVFHRLHYLTLRSDERINRLHIKCSFCQEFIEHPFYYDCHSNCRFIIHIKCTLLLKSHEHNFIVLMRPEDFTCDACGIACDPYFMGSLRLLCTVCQIVIHEQCKSLQRMISILQHHHALTHTYIIQENGYFQRAECTICRKQVNTRYGSYYCRDCCFVVHVNCAFRNRIEKSVVQEAEGFSAILDKEEERDHDELNDDKLLRLREIEHFSHRHKLTLFNDIEQEDKYCEGCITPIFSSTPYYRCVDCDFILHKICTQLPKQIKHPTHKHILTLVANANIFCPGIFYCSTCHNLCQGFAYVCKTCPWGTFQFCARCASVPHKLKHPGHEHELSLVLHTKEHCVACDDGSKPSFLFQCDECSFALDYRCATLPQKVFFYDKPLPQIVWPKDYDQPSILTYKSIDKGYDEYYCDICETERDPHHWFYYCENYDCCGHPKCTLGKYPYIKRGSQFQLWSLLFFLRSLEGYSFCDDCSRFCSINQLPLTVESDFHTHTLTLAYKPSCDRDSNRNFCDLCKKFHAEHLLYYCGKCKFQVHPQCVFHREVIYSQAKNLIFYERSMGYLRCLVCGEDCKGLSLKCQMSECNFSIHFDCRRGLRDIIPKDLQRLPQALG
ncbi:putative Cysteine/Histidine-rich C1 domain family protein [Tripterygium wilfordii]|uniref:Putative Cysteine/Histidine-rich C1 domain family protein n=1 Tax=Tripterygium wilfordii TaxID=458696 RepID=A0A7J7CXQ0_TRIWF|nr:uncharacterized protein LOC120012729 isoform X1 [Tripterygium wilfordii]KAF5738656.1 putative Cysteine/Histidine-rich C1 domain family protein [Tripterygium wilfordii]